MADYTDFGAEQQAIERRRKFSEMLQQQAFQPLEQQTVSGRVVPTSPMLGVAQLAKALLGGHGMAQADQQGQALAQRRSAALAQALGGMPQARQETTAQPYQAQPGTTDEMVTPPDAQTLSTRTVQPSWQQNVDWMGKVASIDPSAMPIASAGLTMQQKERENEENRHARTQDKILALEATAQNQRLMMSDRQAARDQAEELRRDLAADSERTRRETQTSQQQFMAEQRRLSAADRAALAGAGKVPPGYRQTPDGNLQAIPGGPADTKLQGALNQDTATLQGSTNSMDRLATAANEALNHPGLQGITGLRGAIPNIPGSAAADAQAKLSTLKSQVGFGVLQDMRNNSKTGGALGSVSDAEGKRLEANLAALENAQSTDQMKDSLRKIIQYTGEAKDRLRNAFNMKHTNQGGWDGNDRRAPGNFGSPPPGAVQRLP